MKRVTLSKVKNLMRRALLDLVDPPPNAAQEGRLRKHFEDACAYCGGAARPREGHIDHAIPGYGSALGNLILACKTCNGDEKREMGWEDFLRLKCGADAYLLAKRTAKIRAWLDANPLRSGDPKLDAQRAAAEQEAFRAFEETYNKLRDLVRARGRDSDHRES